MHVEGVRKIENPDEANIIVIMVSENIHQWILKSVGQSLQGNMILILFPKISPKIISCKGKLVPLQRRNLVGTTFTT